MKRAWKRALGICAMTAAGVGIMLAVHGVAHARFSALQERPGIELYGETTLVTARDGRREPFDPAPRTLSAQLYLDPQADSPAYPEQAYGNVLFGVVTDEGLPSGSAPVQLFRDAMQFDLAARELCCEDVNFDGYPDIYYMVGSIGASKRYSFWCWEPRLQRFVHNAELSALCSPSFSEDGTVYSWSRGSALDHECDMYSYQGGGLVCVRRWSYTGAGGDVRLFCEDWIDRRWQTAFEAEVPYEAMCAIWEKEPFPAAYAEHERHYRFIAAEFERYLDRFYRGGNNSISIKMEQKEQ